MSDFLDRLLAQSRPGPAAGIVPRRAGRFETTGSAPGDVPDMEEIEAAHDRPPVGRTTSVAVAGPDMLSQPLSDVAVPPRPERSLPAAATAPSDPTEPSVVVRREAVIAPLPDTTTSPGAAAPPMASPPIPWSPQEPEPEPIVVRRDRSSPMARPAPLQDDIVPIGSVVERRADVVADAPPAVLPVVGATAEIAPTPGPPPGASGDPLRPAPAVHDLPATPTAAAAIAAPATPIPPPPVVHIHIGRIEIDAASEAIEPRRLREGPRAAPSPSALDRYLRRS